MNINTSPQLDNKLNQDYLDYYRNYIDESNPDLYDSEITNPNQKKGLGEVFPDSIRQSSDTFLSELQDLTKIEKEKAFQHREKDYQNFTAAIEDFFSEIEEARKETGMTVEQILNEMFKIQSEIRDDSAEIAQEQVKEDQKEVRKLNKERIEKLKESLERAKSTQFWNRFEKAVDIGLSVLGIATTAAAIVGTGGTAAVVVGAITIGNTIDGLLGDSFKKGIISAGAWAIPAGKEKKEKGKEIALAVLKVGLTIASLFAAYKYIPSVTKDVVKSVKPLVETMETIGTGVQIGTQGMQVKNQYQMNQLEGDMSDATFKGKKQMDKVKGSIKGLETLFKGSLEEWESRKKVLEASQDVVRTILSS